MTDAIQSARAGDGTAPAGFPVAIWQLLLTVADRNGTEYTGPWEGPNGEPMQDDADAALAWINALAAAPAVSAPAWRPIETAPKDGTPVDLWRGDWRERVTNMRRVQLSDDNTFYEPAYSGPCCVRDATHWMFPPSDPDIQAPATVSGSVDHG